MGSRVARGSALARPSDSSRLVREVLEHGGGELDHGRAQGLRLDRDERVPEGHEASGDAGPEEHDAEEFVALVKEALK